MKLGREGGRCALKDLTARAIEALFRCWAEVPVAKKDCALFHIRRKSHPFCCITSRQWTFCGCFFGVASPEEEVVADMGVGSHVSEGRVVSSALRQTSRRSRTILPKLPISAWSPSRLILSAKTLRNGLVGTENEPQISRGQTRDLSKPSVPEGM
jgi:hypothetical protein